MAAVQDTQTALSAATSATAGVGLDIVPPHASNRLLLPLPHQNKLNWMVCCLCVWAGYLQSLFICFNLYFRCVAAIQQVKIVVPKYLTIYILSYLVHVSIFYWNRFVIELYLHLHIFIMWSRILFFTWWSRWHFQTLIQGTSELVRFGDNYIDQYVFYKIGSFLQKDPNILVVLFLWREL